MQHRPQDHWPPPVKAISNEGTAFQPQWNSEPNAKRIQNPKTATITTEDVPTQPIEAKQSLGP